MQFPFARLRCGALPSRSRSHPSSSLPCPIFAVLLHVSSFPFDSMPSRIVCWRIHALSPLLRALPCRISLRHFHSVSSQLQAHPCHVASVHFISFSTFRHALLCRLPSVLCIALLCRCRSSRSPAMPSPSNSMPRLIRSFRRTAIPCHLGSDLFHVVSASSFSLSVQLNSILFHLFARRFRQKGAYISVRGAKPRGMAAPSKIAAVPAPGPSCERR